MTTISWVILTYNRHDTVNRAIAHCMENAGATWDELIWVDNGSENREYFQLWGADIIIAHKENMGVAKGYNHGMALATKDYIVITGCDMLMPKDWLATFKKYVEAIPYTGVATIYSKPLSFVSERVRGPAQLRGGLPIVPALALERRIFKRSLLAEFGYFPESFGFYGWDDIAWAERAELVAMQQGLENYVIPTAVAEHLGTEGINAHDGKDESDYHAFKRKEALDAAKRIEFERLRSLGWPRFSPFY